MSNSKSIDIKHVLCCDAVRIENSGKEMLLGVYHSTIVMKELPESLQGLNFRMESKVHANIDSDFTCALVGPKNDIAGQISGRLKVGVKGEGGDGLMHIPISPINFSHSGTHRLRFSLDKERPRTVFEIDVRLPKPGDPTFSQVLLPAQPAPKRTRKRKKK
jgi:Family of unknown function (DUF6941)